MGTKKFQKEDRQKQIRSKTNAALQSIRDLQAFVPVIFACVKAGDHVLECMEQEPIWKGGET